ncbi:hypothetical protein, conserved [Eimeria maxima]|uniref:Uncharacterized protein n=1 Tax=Eimeria maxima TaxID=5804 RepID=U6M2M7_EIMMA|nr:hypothetical protein, conserved [Eimeria maxima]CDJ58482.1 hypothetical protein, conserved [Eimeria maxima]
MYLPLQTQGETSIDYPLPDSFASDGKKKEHEGERVERILWHATPSRAPVGSAASLNRLTPLLLLSIFGVLLLIAKCASRVSSSRVERGRTARRLAGGVSPPPSDEDPDVTAIVNLCLELEQSSPDLLQRPQRPPQPALQQHASQQQQQQRGILVLPQRGERVLLLPQQGQQQALLVKPFGGQQLRQQQQGQQQLVIQQQQGRQVLLVPGTGPRMLLVPQQGQQVLLVPQQRRQQQHLHRQILFQAQQKRTQGDSATRPPHQASDLPLHIQQRTNLATQYLVSPVPTAATTSTKATTTTPGTTAVSQQPLSDGSSSAATLLPPERPHPHTATAPGPADGGSLMQELEAGDAAAKLSPSVPLKELLGASARRGGETGDAAAKLAPSVSLKELLGASARRGGETGNAAAKFAPSVSLKKIVGASARSGGETGDAAAKLAPSLSLKLHRASARRGSDLHSGIPAKRLMLQVPTEKGGRANMPAYPSESSESQTPVGFGGPTSPDVWLSDSALNLYLHYNKIDSDDSMESLPSVKVSDASDEEEPGPSTQPTGHANKPESHLHPAQLRSDGSLGSSGGALQARTSSYQDGASAGSSGTALQASTSSYQDGASAGSSGTAIGGHSTGLPASSGPLPLDEHPFYRLPVLAPGVSTPPLSIMESDESYGPQGMAHRCLMCLRDLFKKEALGEVDARKAYVSAIRLAKFLLARHRTRVREMPPVRAAYVLGRRYLLLDSIVSVLQVLGNFEESRREWEAFVKLIPTTLVIHKKGGGPSHNLNRRMVSRLMQALELLKQGKRPSAEETVELKRYLFKCLPTSDFSCMDYNPYRRDDAEWISRGGT